MDAAVFLCYWTKRFPILWMCRCLVLLWYKTKHFLILWMWLYVTSFTTTMNEIISFCGIVYCLLSVAMLFSGTIFPFLWVCSHRHRNCFLVPSDAHLPRCLHGNPFAGCCGLAVQRDKRPSSCLKRYHGPSAGNCSAVPHGRCMTINVCVCYWAWYFVCPSDWLSVCLWFIQFFVFVFVLSLM